MNRHATARAIVAIAAVALGHAGPASAAQGIALESVAAELGYTYSYLGPEDAVSLSKPGITILVRPGERLFDVNDRTEAMDGDAPRFSRDDVYVSDGFVRRLRRLASLYRSAPVRESAASMSGPPAGELVARPVTGSITGLIVTQVPGRQAVYVRGKAPAGAAITLTLVSTMSVELPDAVLNRHHVVAGASGAFDADLPVAPGYFRGSIITVVASSTAGVAPATTRITMKAPNQDLPIPADDLPRSIR